MTAHPPRRVFVVVIDALGVGGLPDAPTYGDKTEFNTLASVDRKAEQFTMPIFEKLGVGNIIPLTRIKPNPNPLGLCGKMSEFSKGKDTTTGHWEMSGVYLDTPFPTYPDGFPKDIMDEFLKRTGCKGFLGNKPASGTEILKELGDEHLQTGYPIVYTSADSVFQIAAHTGPESKVTLKDLYFWCETAREIMRGGHEVSRIIARPFIGKDASSFKRVGEERRDYALSPTEKTALDRVREQDGIVFGVGKIEDIFNFVGLTHSNHTGNNASGLEFVERFVKGSVNLDDYSLEKKKLNAYTNADKQFVFINLVETDSVYGHRRDVSGYARALEVIDEALGRVMQTMTKDDLLMITGDHGCDPTAPGSDHTREYVPIVMYSPALKGGDLKIRESFADIGQTTLAWLNLKSDGQRGKNMLESQHALA